MLSSLTVNITQVAAPIKDMFSSIISTLVSTKKKIAEDDL